MTAPCTTMHRSLVKQELYKDLKTLSVVALAITVALTVSTCHYDRSSYSNIGLTVRSLNLSEAEEVDSSENSPRHTSWKNSIATNGYYITGVSQRAREATGGEPPSISVFGRRSSDKTLAWATRITANDFTQTHNTHPQSSPSSKQPSQSDITFPLNPSIVSPDGKYVAFKLNSESTSVTYFAVVETSTGTIVRSIHFARRIIGTALTDTHLAVETADQPFPRGTGGATLTVLPLLDRDDPPVTLPTAQWLVGSSHRSLLMSDSQQGDHCSEHSCVPRTVTRIDGRGRTINTITGVIDVYSGGWISRYSDPAAASSLLTQIYDPVGQQERNSAGEQLSSIRRDLINPDSGQITDITGLEALPVGLPTGQGLLLQQKVPSEGNTAKYTPVFWLSAVDDGHPHTENLEQFSNR